MKKLILVVLIALCSFNLRAADNSEVIKNFTEETPVMNAYGVSFDMPKEYFLAKIQGTFLDLLFAVDVEEKNGVVESVTGIKEMTNREDANIIFSDTVYSILTCEKYLSEENYTDNRSHYIYTIGKPLSPVGFVDVYVSKKFVTVKFSRNHMK